MDLPLAERCRRVRLLLTDVDGVLTDGSLWFDDRGGELKRFHVRDGQGFRLYREAGGWTGIVSSRTSAAVERRAAELQLTAVRQGIADKLASVRALCGELGIGLEEVAYLGDDLVDVPAIAAVGVGAAVADAVAEARAAALYVTRAAGGQGALRELAELLLQASGRWESALLPYLRPAS